MLSTTSPKKQIPSSQCHPSVSHIHWSSRLLVNSIVRWVSNISEGKDDTRQTLVKTEFIEGGTVGSISLSAKFV